MFIEIQALERHPIDFAEEFAPGAIDLGTEVQQESAIKASGRAQLVEEHHGKHQIVKDIRIKGEVTVRLQLLCARCLEPVKQAIQKSVELLYRPQGTDAGRAELSVTTAEAEIGYYQGEGVLLEDVLREQILLDVPLKVICREDCKGLCAHCGENLNEGTCSCAEPVEDPRWAALKEIRGKLES